MARNLVSQRPKHGENFILEGMLRILTFKANLMQRTIIDCSTCDQGKNEAETALHALWACKELDVVWGDANLWGFRRSTSFLSFKELLSWIIKNHQQPELFAVTGWSIWNQ